MIVMITQQINVGHRERLPAMTLAPIPRPTGGNQGGGLRMNELTIRTRSGEVFSFWMPPGDP